MAATIDLSSVGALPERFPLGSATQTLKEQIETGAILRDMYHKKTFQLEESSI